MPPFQWIRPVLPRRRTARPVNDRWFRKKCTTVLIRLPSRCHRSRRSSVSACSQDNARSFEPMRGRGGIGSAPVLHRPCGTTRRMFDENAACGIFVVRAQISATLRAENWSKSSSCSVMFQCKLPSVISAANSAFVVPSMIASVSNHEGPLTSKERVADKPSTWIW
jgi:hypothetical protein